MIECAIRILTPIPIERREYGRRLFSVLLKHFPTYIPQRYGHVEPLRNVLAPGNLESALECWGRQYYMAERSTPKVSMMASFAPQGTCRNHSSLYFTSFQLMEVDELTALTALVKELANVFVADYAMAHILTRHELEDWFEDRLRQPTSWPSPSSEVMVANMRAKVQCDGYVSVLHGTALKRLHSVHLKRCLPNLYWLNIFGPPYVDMFKAQRLLDVPSASVETLPYGGISVALTTAIADTAEAWSAFKAIRETSQDYLGSNVFCKSNAGEGYQYRTPHFTLSASS